MEQELKMLKKFAAEGLITPEVHQSAVAQLFATQKCSWSNIACTVTTPPNPSIVAVQRVFETWGSGGYAMPDVAMQNIARDCNADCVFDATAATTNTDMYKVYHGNAGVKAWTDNLLQFDFPDFEPKMVAGDDASTVFVFATYTPTLKATGKTAAKTTDMQRWVVKGGKIQSVKFYWGDIAALDALFVTEVSAMETVGRVFQTWGTGGYAMGDAAANMARDWAADCVTDATGTHKNTDMYKLYNGIPGVKEWLDNLLQFDFPDFSPSILAGPTADTVMVKAEYTPTLKATGKTTAKKMMDLQYWTVKDDKVQSVKFMWGDVDAVDALFVPDTDFFFVKHIVLDAEKTQVALGKAMADPEASAKMQAEAGVFNHMFIPTADPGLMFCLWEVKAGMSAATLKQFLDANILPADIVTNVPMQVPKNGMGLPTTPMKPVEGGKNFGKSTFYVVEHQVVDGAKVQAELGAVMSAMDQSTADQHAANVHNHCFFPTTEGTMFCIWEAKAGVTQAQLEAHLNAKILTPAAAKNIPYQILDMAAGLPNAYF